MRTESRGRTTRPFYTQEPEALLCLGSQRRFAAEWECGGFSRDTEQKHPKYTVEGIFFPLLRQQQLAYASAARNIKARFEMYGGSRLLNNA